MGNNERDLLMQKIKMQEDMIANMKNYTNALHDIIDRQQSCINHLMLLNFGGDLNG